MKSTVILGYPRAFMVCPYPLLQPHFCCSLALPDTPELITRAVPLSLHNLFLLPWKPSHLFLLLQSSISRVSSPPRGLPYSLPHPQLVLMLLTLCVHGTLFSPLSQHLPLWIVIVLLLVCLPRLDFELNNRDLVKCTEEPGRPLLGGRKSQETDRAQQQHITNTWCGSRHIVGLKR